MKKLMKWLLGKEETSIKAGNLWNLVASTEYSMQSALLLLVVTRFGGLYDAGVFTIAFTLAQMLAVVGNYNMRGFQVSDMKQEYSYAVYQTSRIISNIIMILVCCLLLLTQDMRGEKMLLTVLLCCYRMVENIEDVIHGEMQRCMRLDVASRSMALRIFLSTVAFGILYVITENLVMSAMALTVITLICTVIFTWGTAGPFPNLKLKFQMAGVWRLLWVCLPLCLGGFLYTYLVNSPKYAIDRILSEQMQSIFSILFMPVFVINMLSSIIFKPLIAVMGLTWSQGNRRKFISILIKQIAIVLLLTLVMVAGGVWIGLDLLEWFYGVELSQYRLLFGELLVFGGITAIDSFFVIVLTVIRQQKWVIVAYVLALPVIWSFMDPVVRTYDIQGAGYIYGGAMGIVMVIMLIVILVTLHKRKKVDGKAEMDA